jgi:paired amphipathic helix protein Sin3a
VTELYQQEQTREGAGGNSATQLLRQEEEISYQKKAELLLSDENCYKFIVVSIGVSLYSFLCNTWSKMIEEPNNLFMTVAQR